MRAIKDGRAWRIGTPHDVAWIAGRTTRGPSITAAVPPGFAAYATCHEPDGVGIPRHEQAIVRRLVEHTTDQPWWLAYLDTGAHDTVFPPAPTVSLYWDWGYVLVEAGPEQALTWRRGTIQAGEDASLPDLFFPADRSWLVTALWDDTWTCVGGPVALLEALRLDPLIRARPVGLDEDVVPPGRSRD